MQDSHLHVTPGPGVEGNSWRVFTEGTPEPRDGNLVGLVGIVCICFCAFATPVDCQRAETVRTRHHPSLLSSCSHLHRRFGIACDRKVVAFCCKNVRHQEVEGRCDTAGVTGEVNIGNHCCPTKVHASNYRVQEKWRFLCLATSVRPFTKKLKYI